MRRPVPQGHAKNPSRRESNHALLMPPICIILCSLMRKRDGIFFSLSTYIHTYIANGSAKAKPFARRRANFAKNSGDSCMCACTRARSTFLLEFNVRYSTLLTRLSPSSAPLCRLIIIPSHLACRKPRAT